MSERWGQGTPGSRLAFCFFAQIYGLPRADVVDRTGKFDSQRTGQKLMLAWKGEIDQTQDLTPWASLGGTALGWATLAKISRCCRSDKRQLHL
jgi:hypothetical protein